MRDDNLPDWLRPDFGRRRAYLEPDPAEYPPYGWAPPHGGQEPFWPDEHRHSYLGEPEAAGAAAQDVHGDVDRQGVRDLSIRPSVGRAGNGRRRIGPNGDRAGGVDRSTSLSVYDTGSQPNTVALSHDDFRIINDPRLAGVNNTVRRMIATGKPAGQIAVYLETREPGLGRLKLPDITEVVGFRRANPRIPISKYDIRLEGMRVPMSQLDAGLNRLSQSAAGAYVENAADAITLGNLHRLAHDPERARLGMAAVQNAHPVASAAGTTAGIAMMAPLVEEAAAALPLGADARLFGDVAYGSVYGASSDEENPWRGAVQGGLTAVVGGPLTRQALRSAKRAIGLGPTTEDTIQRLMLRGETRERAEYLAQPYVGMGEHYFARNGKYRLPQWLSDSPLNVLKPRGINRDDFYKLHYMVDPSFHGARMPNRFGRGWSGKALGLEEYGPIGRAWYGSPTPLKLTVGTPLGALGYYETGEDD